MQIKLYSKQQSKNAIKKMIRPIVDELDEFNILHIHQWLKEQVEVKCYTLNDTDGSVVTFLLMSKCDFDPMGYHENPYTLNFIYTSKKYRRRGFACKMLLYIKYKEDTTAFCSSDESNELFNKAGFICANKALDMYRSS